MSSLGGVISIVAKAHMMLARFWGLLSIRVDAAWLEAALKAEKGTCAERFSDC